MTATTALLNGFYAPGFGAAERQRVQVGSAPPGMERDPRRVTLEDARAAQAAAGLSEADFLARHGFVLALHPTRVEDWRQDVEHIYGPEVEALIRERLLPGRRIEVRPGQLVRRGRGTAVPFYATGVHSDGGEGVDDHVRTLAAFAGEEPARRWRARYAQDDVEGLIWLNVWRPTHMTGPLEHMPLALCDTASVDASDLVPTAMTGLAPGGRETHHLSLRFNEGQRWFYYPAMVGDEVLAFKLAEFWKTPSPNRNVFHSAFAHPDTPAGAEERQSCELRIGVLVLKD